MNNFKTFKMKNRLQKRPNRNDAKCHSCSCCDGCC